MGPLHEKIWGKVEKPCFARKPQRRLLTCCHLRGCIDPLYRKGDTVLTTFGQGPPLVTTLQTCHGSPSSPRELLGKCSDALHEAFAAYRAYHRLTSNRIPHDAALRKAFGLDAAREC